MMSISRRLSGRRTPAARDITDDGEILAWAKDAGGDLRPCLLESDGGLTSALPLSYPGTSTVIVSQAKVTFMPSL